MFDLDRQEIFVGIAIVALVSGLFSPLTAMLVILSPVWLPEYVTYYQQLVVFLAQLACSALTILAGGVPAAIYERAAGRPAGDRRVMWVWLAGTAAMTLPAIPVMLRMS